MKLLIIALSFFGYNTPKDSRSTTRFTKSETEFINNIIKLNGEPNEIYHSGKNIQVNYSNQRLSLGQDGFIHELEVLVDGQWINAGPEFWLLKIV